MEYPTYATIKQRVEERIDTQEETFVGANELLRYCQDAIDFCENKIHTFQVADRYFETVAPLAIQSGVMDYQMPSDIYANKITRLMHERNDDIYEISRLKNKDRYGDMALYLKYSQDTTLRYMIFNNSSSVKPVIRLFPRPQFSVSTYSPTISTTSSSKTITVSDATGIAAGQFISATGIPNNTRVEIVSGTTITLSAAATATGAGVASTFTNPDILLYYLRNVTKPTADTDVIEIPEFSNYIVQYMVVECLKKDTGNPRLAEEKERLNTLEENMSSTLADMVPDQMDRIEIDQDIYTEAT